MHDTDRANSSYDLDIVIPVYNEGRNIIPVVESLRRSVNTPFRILICYDYNGDPTLDALREYGISSDIVFVKNPSRGPHAAVLAGFEASNAPAVLVFPGDDTYNAPVIDTMVRRFNEGCKIVAASRFMKGGNMIGCPLIKSILVRTANFTLYYLARVPVHDSTNGFRLFSREVIRTMQIESSKGFTYSIELLMKAHRLEWRICEVPVQWYERSKEQGRSNFKLMRWLFDYLPWYFYGFATRYLGYKEVKSRVVFK